MQIAASFTSSLRRNTATSPRFGAQLGLDALGKSVSGPPKFVLIPGPNGCQTADSKPLAPYTGPMDPAQGLSTPADGEAGNFLKASWTTPLSTSGVQDCAVGVLLNSNTHEHLLIHGHPMTPAKEYEALFRRRFEAGFDQAILVPGYLHRTQYTVDHMAEALHHVNPHATLTVKHAPAFCPEIVAYNGDVYFLPAPRMVQASFKVVRHRMWG